VCNDECVGKFDDDPVGSRMLIVWEVKSVADVTVNIGPVVVREEVGEDVPVMDGCVVLALVAISLVVTSLVMLAVLVVQNDLK